MLKGRSYSALYSILLHLGLLALINHTLVEPPKNTLKVAPKTIKSFLYTPPKIDIKPQQAPEAEPVNDIKETVEKAITQNAKTPEQALSDSETSIVSPKNVVQTKDDVKQATDVNAPLPKSPTRKFSALTELNKLRQNMNQRVIDQETYQYGQVNSGSILDGEPELVPHSSKVLSEEEKTENASYQLGAGMKTVKGDDGSCTIERDLSAVGMEGLTSVESFSCGQSKFDKSFKAHMKKVREKLGK